MQISCSPLTAMHTRTSHPLGQLQVLASLLSHTVDSERFLLEWNSCNRYTHSSIHIHKYTLTLPAEHCTHVPSRTQSGGWFCVLQKLAASLNEKGLDSETGISASDEADYGQSIEMFLQYGASLSVIDQINSHSYPGSQKLYRVYVTSASNCAYINGLGMTSLLL